MKKEWKGPKIQNLDMQYTEFVMPIIYYSDSKARIAPNYSWQRHCYLSKSQYTFNSQTEADEDFYGNYLPICINYNQATDSCTIS